MNKFLTILAPLILVVAFHGIVWSDVTEDSPPLTAGPSNTQTSSGLPARLMYSRFAVLGKKSPFTLASSTEEAADFAKDLYLAGFARLAGEDYVVVASKNTPERVLVGKKPVMGMLLLEVKKDPGGDWVKTEARIKKGGEVATLKYEALGVGEAAVAPPMTVQQPGGIVPPVPSIPGMPNPIGQNQPRQAGGAQVPKAAPADPIRVRRRIIPIPGRAGQ